jgi:proline iminopeptidase
MIVSNPTARWWRRAGPVAVLAAVMVVAVVLGFAATVATAIVTARPAVFLVVGLFVMAGTATLGMRWPLRRLAPEDRAVVTAALVGLLVVVGATSVLAPLPDAARGAPAPVPGQSVWQLGTGSRLAHVTLPGRAPIRPTPIVVLHGGPGVPDLAGDVAYFRPLTALGFDVIVYEQLGAGRSSRLADPTGYGIDRDVADLEEIRRVLGVERMVLVGHSNGGALAAHYLARYPAHVQALILSSPGPLDPADTSPNRATAGLDGWRRLRTYAATLTPRALLGYSLLQVNPSAAHAYFGDAEADARNDSILSIAEPALHCSAEQSHGVVRGTGFYALQYPQSAGAARPADVRPTLAGLDTPTLIFKGSCDYLSWRSAQDYRRALPDSHLLYLEGAGHNTYQDRPAEVMAAIRAFLTDAPLPLRPYVGTAPPPSYQGPS